MSQEDKSEQRASEVGKTRVEFHEKD